MQVNEKVSQSADLASVLVSPLRLAILERLLAGPCIVGELTAALGVAQAVASKQIGILRDAGLLVCEPNGRCRSYSLADAEPLRRLLALLAETAERAAKRGRCAKQRAEQP